MSMTAVGKPRLGQEIYSASCRAGGVLENYLMPTAHHAPNWPGDCDNLEHAESSLVSVDGGPAVGWGPSRTASVTPTPRWAPVARCSNPATARAGPAEARSPEHTGRMKMLAASGPLPLLAAGALLVAVLNFRIRSIVLSSSGPVGA